ncbi:hypothetical protein B0I08_101302 [Glaciihabitans tibetensis]|uniref:Lipocalin-like protein n=1 Tax=Glaciihabitans tibetensis TaxID=1266600 RepID=A0A2T0VIY4_9MICO|nr:hypothetical protein [Glaciihabitans tibetensis]PRY70174.1 hypothetical protein B0I08_101302 [Glaciihabitans tibetensis]
MLTAPDEHQLAEILPGTWRVVATNFPMWLRGDRLDPTFTFATRGTEPLVLTDDVSYTTQTGEVKHLLGVDTWRGEGFVWRGKGLGRLVSSSWTVPGVSAAGTIAAIRFSKSLVSPAGIDIVVRDGISFPEPRAAVATESKRFGLTTEDFASLSWLSEQNAS